MHIVGFIMRIYHYARSPELQIRKEKSTVKQIVQNLTMGKAELYDMHKAKSKIRNELLICSYCSMKQKMS